MLPLTELLSELLSESLTPSWGGISGLKVSLADLSVFPKFGRNRRKAINLVLSNKGTLSASRVDLSVFPKFGRNRRKAVALVPSDGKFSSGEGFIITEYSLCSSDEE